MTDMIKMDGGEDNIVERINVDKDVDTTKLSLVSMIGGKGNRVSDITVGTYPAGLWDPYRAFKMAYVGVDRNQIPIVEISDLLDPRVTNEKKHSLMSRMWTVIEKIPSIVELWHILDKAMHLWPGY